MNPEDSRDLTTPPEVLLPERNVSEIAPRLEGPQVYEAWIFGRHEPDSPGSQGISASAWIIRSPEGLRGTPHAIASRNANRREWGASIMAVVGVLENLPRQCAVRIHLTNDELKNAYNHKFLKTNGDLYAGDEHWTQLHELEDSKQITVELVLTKQSDELRILKNAAKKVIANRRCELGKAE